LNSAARTACHLIKEEPDFMRADSVPGAVFPDCELTDHTGARRKFSNLPGPGMKSVRERGRKDRFSPYGKSYAMVFGERE
jgi:hypothetical protein